LNSVAFLSPRLTLSLCNEIRAVKTGERVTVGPGHGGPGLSFFRSELLLWNLVNAAWFSPSAAETHPPVSPRTSPLPRISETIFEARCPSPGFSFWNIHKRPRFLRGSQRTQLGNVELLGGSPGRQNCQNVPGLLLKLLSLGTSVKVSPLLT